VTPEVVEQVVAVSMFSGLAERTITKLLRKAAIETVGHDTLLFVLGQPARCFYVVLQGQVELYVVGDGGGECVIDVSGPGDSIAEEAIFGPGVHPVSAKSIGETRLLVVEAAAFLEQLSDDFDLVLAVAAGMSQRTRALVQQICSLRLKSAAQRLGSFMLDLAEAAHGSTTVRLPFGKRLLAERLGMTPESLSRALRKLRKVGVTSCKGVVTIADVAKLTGFCREAPRLPPNVARSEGDNTASTRA
jgi:CRP/FNR family transcriptional activator FtrB